MWSDVREKTRPLLEAALGLFYPEVCQLCGEERATSDQGYVGADCRSNVRFITPPFCDRCGLPAQGAITTDFTCGNCADVVFHFQSARAAVLANPFMLHVIHRYKYNRALYFEPFLVDLLLREALPVLGVQKWDLVVPVPLHPVKRREREFNQAERLAGHLGRALQLPVHGGLVQRTIPTQTQTRLNREERAANVRNAFQPLPKARLDGKRVILVDDVMTTCATTNACAKALRQAGAGEICVWTVARGI